jgi:hypothetical protein
MGLKQNSGVINCKPGHSLIENFLMQLKDLPDGFMRVQHQSESASPEVLRKTFADIHPPAPLLSISDNRKLFGRPGLGKAYVPKFLGNMRQANGDLPGHK